MEAAGTPRPDEAARLEAALERISRARTHAPDRQPASRHDTAELARRLDALIADLRATLGRDSAD